MVYSSINFLAIRGNAWFTSPPQGTPWAELQGLAKCGGLDGLASPDRRWSGHPQDSVIAPGGEPKAVEGSPHQLLAVFIQGTEAVQLHPAQLGAGGAASEGVSTGPVHPGLDPRRMALPAPAGTAPQNSGHPPEQRGRYGPAGGRTGRRDTFTSCSVHRASAGGVAVPAAFAGVHGAYQHEPAGIGDLSRSPGDLTWPSSRAGGTSALLLGELGQLCLKKARRCVQEKFHLAGDWSRPPPFP